MRGFHQYGVAFGNGFRNVGERLVGVVHADDMLTRHACLFGGAGHARDRSPVHTEHIDARLGRDATGLRVALDARYAEFAHIAEHGNATARGLIRPKRGKSSAHRFGSGIVGVVEHHGSALRATSSARPDSG